MSVPLGNVALWTPVLCELACWTLLSTVAKWCKVASEIIVCRVGNMHLTMRS